MHLELGAFNDLGFDLDLMSFRDGELDRLLNLEPGNDDSTDASGSGPTIIVPELSRNPVSRRGDLWILGDHQLLCGGSTDSADVRRLMNGERAVLFSTDPPYLVDYDGSHHPERNKEWSASYEPFSGSGSQIRAGESNGHRVYAMEISEGYVDVGVARWRAKTGREAVLEGEGAGDCGRTFAAVREERLDQHPAELAVTLE